MPEEVIEKPKFRKEIQPTNDKGEPIGSPHVYEADTMEELLEKVSAGVANGTKKIHELTRQVRLGTPAKLEAPEGLDPAVEIPAARPRQLTADESFELTQQFKDPAAVGTAFDRTFEARFGKKPEELAKEVEQTRRDAAQLKAYYEAAAFKSYHPEYHDTSDNNAAMIGWLESRQKAVTVKNLEAAFKALMDDGLLSNRPTEAKAIPEPEIPARTEPEVETRTRSANPPSALRRQDGSASQPVRSKKPTAAEIAMMTGEQILAAIQAGKLTDADLR